MKKTYLYFFLLVCCQGLYAQAPVVSSFSPASGPIGTTVMITGSNFSSNAANNVVYFGNNRATVTAATATQLTVTAPASSANLPISVLNKSTALSGYSQKPFINTFARPAALAAANFDTRYDVTATTYPNINKPYTVLFADLDGDGKQDMIICNTTSKTTSGGSYPYTISVLPNTSTKGATLSTASFGTELALTATPSSVSPGSGGLGPYAAAVGDLDGDGRPDIVVSNYSNNTISIFHNTTTAPGSISFTKLSDITTGTGLLPKGIVIGDFDNDGKPDVAVACSGNNIVCIFPNITTTGGAITFGAVMNNRTYASGPLNLAEGDLDGDGKVDLVVSNATSSPATISFFRNSSTPGSISFEIPMNYATTVSGVTVAPLAPYGISIGDLDGDGKPEVVVGTWASTGTPSNNVIIYRNTTTTGATFTTTSFAQSTLPDVTNIYGVTMADMDGDGKLDLVTANYNGSSVGVFRNTTTTIGSITFAPIFTMLSASFDAETFVCDIDGDGKPDIGVANTSGTSVSLFRNNPTPYLTASAGTRTYTTTSGLAGTSVKVDSALTIFSRSITTLSSATVAIAAPGFTTGQDVLTFTSTAGTGNITGIYNSTTGILSLSSATPKASVAQWLTALTTITYSNSSLTPVTTPRMVTFLANDGTSNSDTAKKVVIISYKSNVAVNNIVLSAGTLSPAFTSGTSAYTTTVPNLPAIITLTPTLNDPLATVTVNGTTVASGSASSPISLVTGSNTITVVVTAQDGTTHSTYTITVTRPLSSDANLSALALSTGTLSPAFAVATTTYNASVSNATASVTITPTAESTVITSIKVNGTTVASGSTSTAIALAVGANTILTVVTAQDATTQTYTVNVYRTKSTTDVGNADLTSLTIAKGTLTPAFNSGITTYTDAVPNETSSITVTPINANSSSVTKVNGTVTASGNPCGCVPLLVGSNTITTSVTSPNGTVKNYVTTVTRAPSANNDLFLLGADAGVFNPAFTPSVTTYLITGVTDTSIIIKPERYDNTATVAYNGSTITDSTKSTWREVMLNPGLNTIPIVVTSQSGASKTYQINVTRATSSNALLAGLTVSQGKLAPAFKDTTSNYKDTVTASTITVMPILPGFIKSKIKINGTTAYSGVQFGPVSTPVGTTTIQIIVTAEDNTTTKTYNISVYHPSSPLVVMAPGSSLNKTYGDPDFAASTTTAPASNVNYTSSNTAVATVVNNVVHIVGAGNTIITATANNNNAVTTTTQTLLVDKAKQTITFVPVAPLLKGRSAAITAISSAGFPVNLSSSNNNVITLSGKANGWTLNMLNAGTAVITAKQDGDGNYLPASESQTLIVDEDGINIKAALSPNGDGINDNLVISNIELYPENKLTIMGSNGIKVFDKSNYDNVNGLFNGHSGITGSMLPQGSYFYMLDYKADGHWKKKSGYIILKY